MELFQVYLMYMLYINIREIIIIIIIPTGSAADQQP